MTITEALETLTILVQQAQTSGIVPIGPYSVALAIFVAGSQATLQSGILIPGENVEVDDIGIAFDMAMTRMRVALSEGHVHNP